MKNSFFDIPSLLRKISASLRKKSARSQISLEKDMVEIEQSSALLGLSEFNFFQLAHAQWYGRELPERDMERIFADYLFKSRVPFWVRHLNRSVQSQQFGRTPSLREFRAPGTDQSVSLGMTLSCFALYIIISGLIVFL